MGYLHHKRTEYQRRWNVDFTIHLFPFPGKIDCIGKQHLGSAEGTLQYTGCLSSHKTFHGVGTFVRLLTAWHGVQLIPSKNGVKEGKSAVCVSSDDDARAENMILMTLYFTVHRSFR